MPSACCSLMPTALALGSVARLSRPAAAGLDAGAMQSEHPPPSPARTHGTDHRPIVHPYRPIAAPGPLQRMILDSVALVLAVRNILGVVRRLWQT